MRLNASIACREPRSAGAKITVIPNGNDFLMPLDTEKTKCPAIVVTVANLNSKKGVDVHIRAVHHLLEEDWRTHPLLGYRRWS